MDIAITDIGSNAVKYKVFSDSGELKEYVREPLRLEQTFLITDFSKIKLERN